MIIFIELISVIWMLTFDNISEGLQEKKNIDFMSGSFFHFSRPFNFFNVKVLTMKKWRSNYRMQGHFGPPVSHVSKSFQEPQGAHNLELLSREGVNKGTKRMNSLPLSPLVISFILRDFTGKTAA